MNLSLEGVGSYSPSGSEDQPGSERLRKEGANPQRRVHPGAGVLRRTPAVSPGSAEEEDSVPVSVVQVRVFPHLGIFGSVQRRVLERGLCSVPVQTCPKAEPPEQRSDLVEDPGIEATVQALERRPAPSLAELDSNSSFSSMDEDPGSDSDPEAASGAPTALHLRPPLVRSRGRGGLRRMSEAFVCFFAPDKRLTRLVEELSRDRRSTFGGMVQDFLLEQREALKNLASSSSSSSPRVSAVQLLQGLRLFLSQAKCCLMDSGELEPPIETLVPENEKGEPPPHCKAPFIQRPQSP